MMFGWTTALVFWFLQRAIQRAHHQRGTNPLMDDATYELLPYRTREEP